MIDIGIWATALIFVIMLTGIFLSGVIQDARDRILEEIRKERK